MSSTGLVLLTAALTDQMYGVYRQRWSTASIHLVVVQRTVDTGDALYPERFGRSDDGGDADVSSSAWLCTTLLGVVIHMCRRHAAPTQAQVRLH